MCWSLYNSNEILVLIIDKFNSRNVDTNLNTSNIKINNKMFISVMESEKNNSNTHSFDGSNTGSNLISEMVVDNKKMITEETNTQELNSNISENQINTTNDIVCMDVDEYDIADKNILDDWKQQKEENTDLIQPLSSDSFQVNFNDLLAKSGSTEEDVNVTKNFSNENFEKSSPSVHPNVAKEKMEPNDLNLNNESGQFLNHPVNINDSLKENENTLNEGNSNDNSTLNECDLTKEDAINKTTSLNQETILHNLYKENNLSQESIDFSQDSNNVTFETPQKNYYVSSLSSPQTSQENESNISDSTKDNYYYSDSDSDVPSEEIERMLEEDFNKKRKFDQAGKFTIY